MIAESANDPPTDEIGGKKNDETNGGEEGIKRAVEKHDFDGSADEDGGMQENHPSKTGVHHLGRATSDHFPLVTPGNAQLDEAQGSNSAEQNEIGDNA
jgi:hypothetical protein